MKRLILFILVPFLLNGCDVGLFSISKKDQLSKSVPLPVPGPSPLPNPPSPPPPAPRAVKSLVVSRVANSFDDGSTVSVRPGKCISFYVHGKDADGLFYFPDSLFVSISFQLSSMGKVYANSACTVQALSATLTSTASSRLFYYQNSVARDLDTVSVSSAGKYSVAQRLFQVGAPEVKGIQITSSPIANRSQLCNGPFSLKIFSDSAATTAFQEGASISLESSSATGFFYASSTCSEANPTVTFSIPAGTNTQNFYYRDSNPNTVNFTAYGPQYGTDQAIGTLNSIALSTPLQQVREVSLASGQEVSNVRVVQQGQKWVVGAVVYDTTAQTYSLLLARYLSSGTLDSTFGTSGKKIFSIADVTSLELSAITIDSSNLIYLVGNFIDSNGLPQYFIRKYNIDGTSQTASFIGLYQASALSSSASSAIIYQSQLAVFGTITESDGNKKSAAAYHSLSTLMPLTTAYYSIGTQQTTGLRVHANGTRLTFLSLVGNQIGVTITDGPSITPSCNAASQFSDTNRTYLDSALNASGQMTVLAKQNSTSQLIWIRYLAGSCSLDTSFGNGGEMIDSGGPASKTLVGMTTYGLDTASPDNEKLVAFGQSANEFYLARYFSTGVIESTLSRAVSNLGLTQTLTPSGILRMGESLYLVGSSGESIVLIQYGR